MVTLIIMATVIIIITMMILVTHRCYTAIMPIYLVENDLLLNDEDESLSRGGSRRSEVVTALLPGFPNPPAQQSKEEEFPSVKSKVKKNAHQQTMPEAK